MVLGHRENRLFTARTGQILDEVLRIYLGRAGRWLTEDETAQEAENRWLREDRQEAYAFLQARLYPLQHGLSVPLYSKEARQFWTLGSILVMFAAEVFFFVQKTEKTWCSAPVVGRLVGAAAVVGCCFFACFYRYLEGDPGPRNALLGPLDYFKLHRRAHELATLEAATKAAIFADENLPAR